MTGTVAAAAATYVWGYPLVTMHRTCAANGGVRRGLVAMERLATAADRTVVAPNSDTLYASGWYDLRTGDVTVDVGAMDRGRYWSVMVLDAYTHVAYVCRRLHGSDGTHVRLTHDPGTRPHVDAASNVIPVWTSTVWVLARVVVDGPGDVPAARRALSSIQVAQRPDRASRGPGRAAPSSRDAAGFFRSLADAVAVDPPAAWHPAPPAGMDALLADLPDADVLAGAMTEGEARIAAWMGADMRGNGWATRARGADFGDDVDYRAAFAKVSLAGHLPAENRSYMRAADGSTARTLRFPPGGEPPVDGFWSLTVYGRDLFLVENELGRYSIGDRTPGLRRDRDGSLAVTIGHERPDDTSNWLPAPAGPCFLALRAYEGHAAVVDARWFPPNLTPTGRAD
jgi:hypothetical protein